VRNEQTIVRSIQIKFGAIIRARRLSSELSQEEVAHRAGLHRTYVTDVERGARNPSLKSIKRLCDALSISLSEVFALVEMQGSADQQSDRSELKKELRRDGRLEILIAGDDVADLDATTRAIRETGLVNTIHYAHNSVELLDFLAPSGTRELQETHQVSAIVLLDLTQPHVGGVEILRRIRENPLAVLIPVIVLVSSESQPALRTAQRIGISSFIVKPVDFTKFVQAVEKAGLSWILIEGKRTDQQSGG
jgi:transcriptional regulator with XRE-family HTH domain